MKTDLISLFLYTNKKEECQNSNKEGLTCIEMKKFGLGLLVPYTDSCIVP